MPYDPATHYRNLAWRRVIQSLDDLANEPDVLRVGGVWQFVVELREACDDISQHVTSDSVKDAMDKLAAGFPRAKKRVQDGASAEAIEWVRQEWLRDRGGFKTKKAFADHYVKRVFEERRVTISEKRLIDEWLKGLPARK